MCVCVCVKLTVESLGGHSVVHLSGCTCVLLLELLEGLLIDLLLLVGVWGTNTIKHDMVLLWLDGIHLWPDMVLLWLNGIYLWPDMVLLSVAELLFP